MLKACRDFQTQPFVPVSADANGCSCGWDEILERLRGRIARGATLLCFEFYPGAFVDDIIRVLEEGLQPVLVIRSADALRSSDDLARSLTPILTEDPVFGRLSAWEMTDFFEPHLVASAQRRLADPRRGLTIVAGIGASLIAQHADVLVYADMTRWEIQQRQRRQEVGSLGAANSAESSAMQYKRGFFTDWRAADRLKSRLFERIHYLLDTNDRRSPKMISGEDFRSALAATVHTPFSVVPFFDPSPWGGQWMKETFGLPPEQANYGWCFNCVPEENSLLLGFGGARLEIPALDLVLRHPRELLRRDVYSRFGAEFPIRFDFLDTMGGGHLSLQVHPLATYIRDHFGMAYTQDESYYIMEAREGAAVFLGLRENCDRLRMEAELRAASEGSAPFAAERYVNRWPARKHDHFLIPAGTIHCSARNSVVLEISATPYIFTFKLWDWGRPGLDGCPRPLHLGHGLANIQWDRTAAWVRRELVNRIEPLAAGPGWREERTGLHPSEFIETRRHWFTAPVPHHTGGTVNVLNLVEGDAAVVESPEARFEPRVIRFAETLIVPAAVGEYTIAPLGDGQYATIKAFVRNATP